MIQSSIKLTDPKNMCKYISDRSFPSLLLSTCLSVVVKKGRLIFAALLILSPITVSAHFHEWRLVDVKEAEDGSKTCTYICDKSGQIHVFVDGNCQILVPPTLES